MKTRVKILIFPEALVKYWSKSYEHFRKRAIFCDFSLSRSPRKTRVKKFSYEHFRKRHHTKIGMDFENPCLFIILDEVHALPEEIQ